MNKNALRSLLFASVAGAVATIGCSADQKTQKQQAHDKWNNTRATVLCSLATDQYKSGNLDKCQQTVNQALQMDATNPALHLLAARVDIELGRLESAERRLRTAGELNPTNGEVDYLMGVVQQRWQRPEPALAAYTRAAEKKPEDPAYVIAQAEMLVQLNDTDRALSTLLDRVSAFEHSAAIRDAIGQLYEQTGQADQAIEYYRQASVLDPQDLGTRERLGLALYRKGEFSDALTQFRRVLRENESEARIDVRLLAAECLLQSGGVAEARQDYEKIAVQDPRSTSAWAGVCKTSLRLGDVRRAEAAIIKAVAIEPNSAQLQVMMGYVRMKQGRLDDAMASFRRASQADKDDAVSLSMIGMIMHKQGRSSDAVEMYRRALSIDPHDELAVKLLASATASMVP
jgi:tetratricopeptide (TPR) repeat protein